MSEQAVDDSSQHDFTQPWSRSDFTFTIMGARKVYANKNVLCMWSPIWSEQLSGADKKEASLTIDEAPFENFLLFMKILHPPTLGPAYITKNNVRSVLPLARKFEVALLVCACENHLLEEDPSLENLYLAVTYKLKKLEAACFEFAIKSVSKEELREDDHFKRLPKEYQIKVREAKLEEVMTVVEKAGSEVEVALFRLESVLRQNRPEMEGAAAKRDQCEAELIKLPLRARILQLAEKYNLNVVKDHYLISALQTAMVHMKGKGAYEKASHEIKLKIYEEKIELLERILCAIGFSSSAYGPHKISTVIESYHPISFNAYVLKNSPVDSRYMYPTFIPVQYRVQVEAQRFFSKPDEPKAVSQ